MGGNYGVINTYAVSAGGLSQRYDGTQAYTYTFDPAGNLVQRVGSTNSMPADFTAAYDGFGAQLGEISTISGREYTSQDAVGFGGQWGAYTVQETWSLTTTPAVRMPLVRMGLRDYDPGAGRFLTRDPIGYEGGIVRKSSISEGNSVSIHDYETAIRLIASHPEKSNFEGPKSEAVVVAAERTLGLQFPATYRRFLLEYGAGTFGSSEIYGVVNEDFIHSGIPDAVWYTLTERQATNLPREYIAIYDVGDGELFCLDVGGKTTEAPVIAFEPGIPTGQQPREIIAEDFGAFLLRIVQRETKK